MGDPPVLVGALKVIVACPLLASAFTLVGTPGTVGITTEFDAVDDALVPATFVAVIVKVYAAPAVSPVTA